MPEVEYRSPIPCSIRCNDAARAVCRDPAPCLSAFSLLHQTPDESDIYRHEPRALRNQHNDTERMSAQWGILVLDLSDLSLFDIGSTAPG